MNELRFAVLGAPIKHSASPRMHAAAFAAMGMSHRYEAVLCEKPAELLAAVDLLRQGRLHGLNITAPHKEKVLALADVVADSAARVGAANTLTREDGRVVAHNTDIEALREELSHLKPNRSQAIIIGAGATAMSALAACEDIGMRLVTVTTRSWTGGDALETPRAARFRDRGAIVTLWPGVDIRTSSKLSHVMREQWSDTVSRADLIIQAGSGRDDTPARLIPWHKLPPTCAAYDVIYDALTPFVARARGAGIPVAAGVGMLVAQGALAFRLWLQQDPPREVMLRAVLAGLGHG